MFIKLTVRTEGFFDSEYINMDLVFRYRTYDYDGEDGRDVRGSQLMPNEPNNSSFIVKETPEEILKLIEGKE